MTFYPNAAPRTLSASHRRVLEAGSANTPEIVAERGTFTARRGKDVPQDHGRLPSKPGMVFPIHTLDGGIFHRLRPDNPGRLPKYMQPKGHPNRLDVHPRQHERIKQPGSMRYITEGEKKVDAGVSRGLLMVGVSGVWNGTKDKDLIPDWDLLPLEGEDYSITFDSDIETNEHVQLAADRMARLLKARGANVFITLLPPSPDGGKQGLDDFFANGGTPKEVELLTRPYEAAVIERVRLTRDQRLRGAIEALWRRWWATEWTGQGGHTDRDLALQVIEAARKHGKLVGDDLRVVKAWGPLMLGAKIRSSRTMGKSVARLEGIEFFERDNGGRQADKAGAFVFRSVARSAARAGVKHYGEDVALAGATSGPDGEGDPGTLHLRAPRLMWSSPKFTPKRGTVSGTHKVRESKPRAPRPAVARLGKVRGAILDALDAAGGTATLQEIADVLHRKRARDIRRRNLPWLEEAGILHVSEAGDTVSLADDWLARLEEARETGGELEAEKLAAERYRERSRAYHSRGRSQAPVSRPSAAGMAAVERSREKRAENMAAHEEQQAKAHAADLENKRFVKRFVHDRLRLLGRIRLELLQQVVRDAGGVPGYAMLAAKSLGCTVERLPEFGNKEFVFAPREWAAA
jgi:hypothetical protein